MALTDFRQILTVELCSVDAGMAEYSNNVQEESTYGTTQGNFNNSYNNYNGTDNGFVYEHTYNNGNVASNSALIDNEMENEQLNSCLKKKEEQAQKTTEIEEPYPVMSAKPSPSLQIIATRNRPCCECIRNNQRVPLCLIFLIFIVMSCSMITGVMFYLKSGKNARKYEVQHKVINLEIISRVMKNKHYWTFNVIATFALQKVRLINSAVGGSSSKMKTH